MNKILKEALIKEINELEKNYSKRDIEIIENLLKQVYKIIRTDEQNVYTVSDKQIKLKY